MSRYSWRLSDILELSTTRFSKCLWACSRGYQADSRDRLLAPAFSVWMEHVGGKKTFEKFCQELGLIEKNDEPEIIRKMKARAAIQRAAIIREADRLRGS